MEFIPVNTKETRVGSNPATPTNRIHKPLNFKGFLFPVFNLTPHMVPKIDLFYLS